jgi:DNA-binding XRE family transcriptional regulator
MTSIRVDDLQHQATLVRAALLGQLAGQRKTLGLTQGELADRTGANRMTVQRAETEGADPQLSTFVELALAAGLTPLLASEGQAGNDIETAAQDIVHRGFNHNRTKRDLNQLEAVLANAWEAVNDHNVLGRSPVMPTVLPGHTQAQASAVATIVQWLGSEVGFDFLVSALGQAGYAIVEGKQKSARR